jgi:hypothetical protein
MANLGGVQAPAAPVRVPGTQSRAGRPDGQGIVRGARGAGGAPIMPYRAHGPSPVRRALGRVAAHVRQNKPAQKQNRPARLPGRLRQPGFSEMSRHELRQLVAKQYGNALKAQEAPLKQQLGEIGGVSKTAAERYGQAAQQAQSSLGQLQSAREASARTAQNELAERAKQRLAQIGQAEGPQAASERQLVTGLNTAGLQTAERTSAADNAFLTRMQAIAAQRAQEGQKELASKYAGQQGEVQGKLTALRAAKPGQVASGLLELLPKQEASRQASKALGLKGLEGARKARLTERGQNVTVRGQNLTASHNAQTARENREYREASLAEKKRLDEANIEDKRAKIKKYENETGQKLSSAAQKTLTDIGRVVALQRQLHHAGLTDKQIQEKLTSGYYEEKSEGKWVKRSLGGAIPNQAVIVAGQEIAHKGSLTRATKQALRAYGVPGNTQVSRVVLGG